GNRWRGAGGNHRDVKPPSLSGKRAEDDDPAAVGQQPAGLDPIEGSQRYLDGLAGARRHEKESALLVVAENQDFLRIGGEAHGGAVGEAYGRRTVGLADVHGGAGRRRPTAPRPQGQPSL